MLNQATSKKEKNRAIIFSASALLIMIVLTVVTKFLYQAHFVYNFKVGIFNLGIILVQVIFYILVACICFSFLIAERKLVSANNIAEAEKANCSEISLLAELGFRKERIGLQAVIGIMFFVAVFIIAVISSLFGIYFEEVRDYYWADLLYRFLLSLLVVGIAEELFMRGYLFAKLKIIFSNKHIIILVSSVVFGLWHFIINESYLQVLFASVLGMVFGYARTIKGGSILSSIITHGLLNAFIPILAYIIFLLS